MGNEVLVIIWEFAVLAGAVYLYLYSRGIIKLDPKTKQRAIEFRDQNKRWLTPLSLFLVAIMLVNIYLHFTQIF